MLQPDHEAHLVHSCGMYHSLENVHVWTTTGSVLYSNLALTLRIIKLGSFGLTLTCFQLTDDKLQQTDIQHHCMAAVLFLYVSLLIHSLQQKGLSCSWPDYGIVLLIL
jgi:hypothetical protein